jgi:hypothetical protein
VRKLERVNPREVEAEPFVVVNDLTPAELRYWEENAASINFLIEEAINASEVSAESVGIALAQFSLFMFRLGRNYADSGSS